ncbi:CmcJ/NvfI family oxidoreductase [Sphingobium sp.]|uniref:CmcJ/NvfI family oxidoreductase n=1 Tax=Sphingobium sp. TaxID=1912891 RepID=UPI0028BF4A37|nr:CmcJ/NvfI family oxidoreductase [Sphingobium sp.]
MVLVEPSTQNAGKLRSVPTTINYLARNCPEPYVNNGDFSKNRLPLEKVEVNILDADAFPTPPTLEIEGFCSVPHKIDLPDLADSREAAASYRESLLPLLKAMTGADELVMAQFCVVRRQELTAIEKDIEKTVGADFVHWDVTDIGIEQVTDYFYARPSRPGMRRMALYNIWKLLSVGPTNLPLAVCDARSVRPEDITAGPAYFPSVDGDVDTGFFHPNDHFRWAYFSKLTSNDVLIFKQYDTDPTQPKMVPHSAFNDPSCPPGAAPRISIESRCMAYWY